MRKCPFEKPSQNEWREQCLTCNKADRIPKWGWCWACNEPICEYEPFPTVEEMSTVTTATKD